MFGQMSKVNISINSLGPFVQLKFILSNYITMEGIVKKKKTIVGLFNMIEGVKKSDGIEYLCEKVFLKLVYKTCTIFLLLLFQMGEIQHIHQILVVYGCFHYHNHINTILQC